MPMPHRTFAQLAKRRLIGKEGRERIREVNSLLAELPDYRNGPYADLRKWLTSEIEETRVRSSAVHRDSIAVRREGAAQIALVGPPNVGKSSILQALSEIQIKTGDYAFTTLRPIPALTRIGGVLVQLVEIPGLIEGANGGPRRRAGAARRPSIRRRDRVLHARGRRPGGAATGHPRDRARGDREARLPRRNARGRGESRTRSTSCGPRTPDLDVVPVSIIDEASLGAFSDAVWRMTGLIRVRLRSNGKTDDEPVALEDGSTVADVADSIHHDLGASFEGARVWGPSARFEGQRVGRDHLVQDGDVVEILS